MYVMQLRLRTETSMRRLNLQDGKSNGALGVEAFGPWENYCMESKLSQRHNTGSHDLDPTMNICTQAVLRFLGDIGQLCM